MNDKPHPITPPEGAGPDEALARADERITPDQLPARIAQWRRERAAWGAAKVKAKRGKPEVQSEVEGADDAD